MADPATGSEVAANAATTQAGNMNALAVLAPPVASYIHIFSDNAQELLQCN